MRTQITTLFLALCASTVASAGAPPTATVVRDSWTDIVDVSPRFDGLLEASYRGKGERSGRKYRLHLVRYLDRNDTFIALLEAERAEFAILGFVVRSPIGSGYLWKEISVTPDFQQILPKPEGSSIFQITAEFDKRSRWDGIRVTGTQPMEGSEVIRFHEARAPLMKRQPVPGEYSNRVDEREHTWSIHVDRRLTATNAVWAMQQSRELGQGTQEESDLARFDLPPGVMGLRETLNNGFEPKLSATIKWVAVNVDRVDSGVFSDSHHPELIVFHVGTASAGEITLPLPVLGHRLRLIDPR